MARGRRRRRSLVFVHGYSCSARHWSEAPERLGDRYALTPVTLPGHGEPALPPDSRLDFADCVRHIFCQIETDAPEGAVLIGHSLGGMLGIACTHERPDLVTCLVLVDAFPHLGQPPPFDRSFWAGSPPALKSRVVREMTARRRRLPGSLWSSIASFDGRPLLAEVRRPVRGIYGDRGEGDHAALAKTLRDTGLARAADLGLKLIAEAGHFVMLEQPEAFWEALEEVLAELPDHEPR